MPSRAPSAISREDAYRMRVLTRKINAEGKPRVGNWRKPGPLVHGTSTGYRRGCRCDDCRIAQQCAVRAYRNNGHAIPPHYHGTEKAYSLHHCHCEKCKAAHAAYCKYQRSRPRCQNKNHPQTAKPCRKLLPDDPRRKYCSDACQIAANVEIRRETWRESKRRNNQNG